MSKEWFIDWFNSPYYHHLYGHRDEKEAQLFIDQLIKLLDLDPSVKVLDQGCGRGRHATYLHSLGFNVTGIDIAQSNIEQAKKSETGTLTFQLHDMRKELGEKYDLILNLFTSFGYYTKDEDNQAVLNATKEQLTSGGYFVLDFMNPDWVVDNLIPEEQRKVGDIIYNVQRSIDDGIITKLIEFEDGGEHYTFTEQVKAYVQPELESMLHTAGLKTEGIYGDYQLGAFDEWASERLIILAKG